MVRAQGFWIKRRTRTKDVPIIFLTAVDKDLSSSYRGYVAGGADYLFKPFDPWILRAKVQVFVDLWHAGRVQASQAALLQGRTAAGREAVSALRARVGELEAAVCELAGELGDGSQAARAALDRVRREVDAVRDALADTSSDAQDQPVTGHA